MMMMMIGEDYNEMTMRKLIRTTNDKEIDIMTRNIENENHNF